jgi:pyruvate formate lyase activating enzyme
MDYLVKLDTNGSRPEIVQEVLDDGLVDYVAMDIKAPLEDYSKIIGIHVPPERLKQSIETIISSGIDYEFRTTIVKSLTSEEDLRRIARAVRGAKRYYLQAFMPTKLVGPELENQPSYSFEELRLLARELETDVKHCGIRQETESLELD